MNSPCTKFLQRLKELVQNQGLSLQACSSLQFTKAVLHKYNVIGAHRVLKGSEGYCTTVEGQAL